MIRKTSSSVSAQSIRLGEAIGKLEAAGISSFSLFSFKWLNRFSCNSGKYKGIFFSIMLKFPWEFQLDQQDYTWVYFLKQHVVLRGFTNFINEISDEAKIWNETIQIHANKTVIPNTSSWARVKVVRSLLCFL